MTRRRVAILVGIVAAIVVVVGVALAGLVAVAQSPGGRAELARLIERLASTPGETELTIGEIGPGLPSTLVVEGLVVADGDGPWLRVDRAVVRWRPWALLRGRVLIEDVDITGARLDRLPEATTTDSGGGLPRPPLPLSVQRLSIGDLALGAAVAGSPATIRVDAALDDADVAVRGHLEATRIDGTPGSLSLNTAYDRRQRTLDVDGRVEEPAGGVISEILDLPGRPDLSARITGSGPLAEWTGRLEARAGDVASLTAEIAADPDHPGFLRLEGKAEAARLMPAPMRPLVEGGAAFAGAGRLDGETLVLERLSAETAALAIEASGTVDLAGGDSTVGLWAESRSAAAFRSLIAPAEFTTASVAATYLGPLTAPDVRLDAEIGGLTMRGVPAGLLGGTVTASLVAAVDGDAGRAWIDRLDAATGGLRVSGEGWVSLAFIEAEATLRAALDDLGPLGSLVDLNLGGRAEADMRLRMGDDGTLDGDVTARWSDATLGDPTADAILGAERTVRADFNWPAGKPLALSAVEAEAGLVRAEGVATVDLQRDSLDFEAEAELAEMAKLTPVVDVVLAGRAVARLRGEGPLDDPRVRAVVTISDGPLPRIVDAVEATFDLQNVAEGPTGTMSARAQTVVGPVESAAQLAVAADWLSVNLGDLTASVMGTRAAGALALALDTGLLEGPLEATLVGFGGPPLAGVSLGGDAVATVELAAGADDAQAADLKVSGERLEIIADGTTVRLSAPRINASAMDLWGSMSGTVRVAADSVTADGYRARGVEASAEGTLEAADVSVRLSEVAGHRVGLEAEGQVVIEDADTRISVARLTGEVDGRPVNLRQPAEVRLADDGLAEANINLAVADGGVEARVERGPEGIGIVASAADVPLALVALAVPDVNATGTLDGSVKLAPSDGRLAGTLALTAAEAVISGPGLAFPPLDGTMDARLAADGLALSARVDGFGGEGLRLSGDLPVTVDAHTLALDADETTPVRGTIRWRGEITPLWELLPLQEHRMAGLGDVDLRIGGTTGAPRLDGTVSVTEGSYEHLIAGTLLRDLTIRADAAADGMVTMALSATDGGTGIVCGEGEVGPLDDGMPTALTLTFEDAMLARRDDVGARGSGSITYQGTTQKGRIEGGVETSIVEVRLVDRLPPSVVALEVVEVDGEDEPGDGRAVAAPADGSSPWSADLDLRLDMPRRVFVRGRGLESEWGGSFVITGTTDRPAVDGAVSVRRGFFEFAGKRFDLRSGSVGLEGGDLDPTLSIEAARDGGGITGIIAAGGRFSSPTVEFRSQPPLPQDEALARALFDKGLASMSPFEAVQVAAAVAALTGGGGGPVESLFGFTRRTLGIDVLTVDAGTGEEGQGPQVGAGRYVGDRTYVGVRQGADLQSGSATVEVEVAPNIRVQSDVGQDASGSIGIEWKWDY